MSIRQITYRRSLKGDVSCRIDCYFYMACFLVPMANLILCFKLNFSIFCGYIWVKNRLYTFKMFTWTQWLHACSNNKQNKYSHSIYEFFGNRATITAFHSHIFRIKWKLITAWARRLFTLKRFQYCRYQNIFQLAFFQVCCQLADHVCCLQVCVNVTTLALIEELQKIWRKICSTQWFHQPAM